MTLDLSPCQDFSLVTEVQPPSGNTLENVKAEINKYKVHMKRGLVLHVKKLFFIFYFFLRKSYSQPVGRGPIGGPQHHLVGFVIYKDSYFYFKMLKNYHK